MSKHKGQLPKKVFDVMRPGKTPAAPSSRPLIVGHKPEMHDEMVGGTTARLDAKQSRPLLNALAKVTIQPQSVPIATQDTPPATPGQADSKASPEAPASTPQPEGLAVSSSVHLPLDEPVPAHTQPLSEQLLAAAAKVPDNPNPLMQHGEHVYVSHHKDKGGFKQFMLVTFIIIILTAIAINFLLDIDLIKTDLNVPHTNWL